MRGHSSCGSPLHPKGAWGREVFGLGDYDPDILLALGGLVPQGGAAVHAEIFIEFTVRKDQKELLSYRNRRAAPRAKKLGCCEFPVLLLARIQGAGPVQRIADPRRWPRSPLHDRPPDPLGFQRVRTRALWTSLEDLLDNKNPFILESF